MLAQTAHHEPVSASLASSDIGGAGGKKKKAAGLAGLFSDILSQAQKNLSPKAADSAKAFSLLKGDGATPTHAAPKAAANSGVNVKVDVKVDVKADAKAKADAKSKEPRSAAPSPTLARFNEPSGVHAADEAQARKGREKLHAARAEDAPDAEAKLRKAADEKRSLKSSHENPADESAAAARAAMVAFKAPTNAISVKAKATSEGGDADHSIEATGKKNSRGTSETKLSVLDLRHSAESRRNASAKVEASAKADDGYKDAIRDTKSAGQNSGHELVHDLSLDARAPEDASSAGKSDSGVAVGKGPDFQSQLAERMRDAWNGEIVKSAHIVLKDGDSGTIRLRLKPESLGNVKIELNLSDNTISGRIIVESDEAKSAFEKNMNHLADAFTQGGFDSARLEVAVGGGSQGGASGHGAGAGDSAGPFYSERLRSAVGSSADPATAVSSYARRGGAVDMFA
jgi:flagellar hook-length control protein FliK